MLKLESTTANDGATTTNWGRTCENCRSAASSVYCRADLAYLCTTCDARIHSTAVAASGHERVWVCESCERAPAAFLCKADSASLCSACDADIHSANPLARRHHRVPILPIHGHSAARSGAIMGHPAHGGDLLHEDDEDEAASWLLMNPMKNGDEEQSINDENGGLFGGEVDDYLDLEDYNSCQNNQMNEDYNSNEEQHYSFPHSSYGGDSVVPMQYNQKGKDCFQMGLDYEFSKAPGYGYPATISHCVSLSSMDVGIVPESTTNEEISISHNTIRHPKGTIDLFSSPPIQIPTQLTPMDREARVLRYREKKKNRKFEKTIRYASRKAYAETRPRIKGRFAKRRDNGEVEVDQMFSATIMENSAYGVVPSF